MDPISLLALATVAGALLSGGTPPLSPEERQSAEFYLVRAWREWIRNSGYRKDLTDDHVNVIRDAVLASYPEEASVDGLPPGWMWNPSARESLDWSRVYPGEFFFRPEAGAGVPNYRSAIEMLQGHHIDDMTEQQWNAWNARKEIVQPDGSQFPPYEDEYIGEWQLEDLQILTHQGHDETRELGGFETYDIPVPEHLIREGLEWIGEYHTVPAGQYWWTPPNFFSEWATGQP